MPTENLHCALLRGGLCISLVHLKRYWGSNTGLASCKENVIPVMGRRLKKQPLY